MCMSSVEAVGKWLGNVVASLANASVVSEEVIANFVIIPRFGGVYNKKNSMVM